MLYLLISIFGIFITIFFVIGTHEAAHFLAARLLNIKVLRFSIGFGKALFRWHDRKGTEYVFAMIPLGGYVKMLDENEGDVPPQELHLAFNRQPFYKKFLVVLAGPAANILCAFILYWLIFVVGFVTIKPIIGTVTPNSIAAKADLKPNQQIISVEQKPTWTWTSITLNLLIHLGSDKSVTMVVKDVKDNKTTTHTLDLSTWRLEGLKPDPFLALGFTPYAPPIPLIIGMIKENSPAATSALKLGDKIVAVNGKPVDSWDDIITTIMSHPEQTLTFTVKRNNKTLTVPVKISNKRDAFFQKQGYLGLGPHYTLPKELLQKVQYGPLAAIPYAWQEMVDLTYFNLLLFGKMLTGKISLQSLGGPITIFESAGDALNFGFLPFISFLAFLSISIGIINLLPVPGLDGGHLVIETVQFVIRKPLPEKILLILYRLGFVLIFFLLFQALLNDILRLY